MGQLLHRGLTLGVMALIAKSGRKGICALCARPAKGQVKHLKTAIKLTLVIEIARGNPQMSSIEGGLCFGKSVMTVETLSPSVGEDVSGRWWHLEQAEDAQTVSSVNTRMVVNLQKAWQRESNQILVFPARRL